MSWRRSGVCIAFEPAVSKGRKHGLCVVGGLQDVVQLKMNLGKDPADAVLACFRSMLALGGANALTTKDPRGRCGQSRPLSATRSA
ncbi:type IV secretion system DNA-binding domain-containing protein [Burkholderia multivorans]|uniref:type IV secretion system DNA-binding domain-containing protein n=1 Tax=Burkholderia multivorans TaxID=87883 RepID=UPI00207C32AB|nr:type IV secretory system conjugative DNA transfer family protein [Burkholderia multivorans]